MFKYMTVFVRVCARVLLLF